MYCSLPLFSLGISFTTPGSFSTYVSDFLEMHRHKQEAGSSFSLVFISVFAKEYYERQYASHSLTLR